MDLGASTPSTSWSVSLLFTTTTRPMFSSSSFSNQPFSPSSLGASNLFPSTSTQNPRSRPTRPFFNSTNGWSRIPTGDYTPQQQPWPSATDAPRSSWSWIALTQRVCALNLSSDLLPSNNDPLATVVQIGTALNLSQAEIGEIQRLVQSLNLSQADLVGILGSCRSGGDNSNYSNENGWPGWAGGGIGGGGQSPGWSGNGGDGDGSSQEQWSSNRWPWWRRRQGNWNDSAPNDWYGSSTFPRWLQPGGSAGNNGGGSSDDWNYNDWFWHDYWDYNDGYNNGNWWSPKQRRIWRWVVLGVSLGVILLLALAILCVAFYRPRVQDRVVVTPYTNQLYTKDGRVDPPPIPNSPMQVYPEVRY